MFCARCGSENPDDGKYCRKCGERIGLIDPAAHDTKPDSEGSSSGKARREQISAGARKFIWGVLLLVIGVFAGIPLKGSQYVDLTLLPGALLVVWSMANFVGFGFGVRSKPETSDESELESGAAETQALPPDSTVFAEDEIPETFETGDLVPASVTEGTTRDLGKRKSGDVIDREKED